jgi:hypothetical protein
LKKYPPSQYQLQERGLYKFLFLGGEQGGMNWEVSRHQFHLFLRWEANRGNLFMLDRTGGVGFVTGRESGTESRGRMGNASGGRGSGGVIERGSGSGSGHNRTVASGSETRGRAPQVARNSQRRAREDDEMTYAGTEWGGFIGK